MQRVLLLSNAEGVVDIPAALVTTLAMCGTQATNAGILDTRSWINASAENLQNGPHRPLSAQSCRPVLEGEIRVDVDETIPDNGEEDRLSGITLKPAIPSAKVCLKHL